MKSHSVQIDKNLQFNCLCVPKQISNKPKRMLQQNNKNKKLSKLSVICREKIQHDYNI